LAKEGKTKKEKEKKKKKEKVEDGIDICYLVYFEFIYALSLLHVGLFNNALLLAHYLQ